MLNRQEIEKLINEKELISGFFDLNVQLTPNGFDLTVAAVSEFIEAGALDFSNKQRLIPEAKELIPVKKNQEDKFGWWHLKPGIYKIRSNEVINLPKDLGAVAFPRSSLLRMGVFSQNGVWDAGFKGKSEFVLVVGNPAGLRLKQNARVIQLVFWPMNETRIGYNGIYQETG